MAHDQHNKAVGSLADLLGRAGWRVKRPSRERDGFDLGVEKRSFRYVVVVKAAAEPRRPLLEGSLASAILRARVAARARSAAPLAVVYAPSISDASLQELRAFAERYGDQVAWGVLDDNGRAVFFASGLEEVVGEKRRVSKPIAPPRFDVFSDLGQWMIKVLLSHQLPPKLQVLSAKHSPVNKPIENAARLADVAGVSVASAARLVSGLRSDHFCDDHPIRLMRRDELLSRWRAVARKQALDVRAKWIFPKGDSNRQLAAALKRRSDSAERACLGLFAACDQLGYPLVTGVSPHLYLDIVSPESLQRVGLRIAEPGEGVDVFVREARFRESVFRGAREHGGIAVADVLQCWLDVSEHPARGAEMSEYLYEKVIEPFVVDAD